MSTFLKKSKLVLGLNARSFDFIRPHNTKKAIRLVDNKLRTKRFLVKNGLPVTELIGSIKNRQEFDAFDWASLPSSFALKPNKGLGGDGIMVTFGQKKNGRWVLPLNREATIEDIKLRVRNILDGDYSRLNVADTAFFEERLRIHPAFKLYAYKGIPDVRVIVYNKVPVMAMLRLPTKMSDGKANLHKGGIGLGIDVADGITTYGIQNDKRIEFLPEMKLPLRGIKIPEWNQVLEMAIQAAGACGLTYAGVDIAFDREKGPVILELNARPGLSIQICNLAPLKERLLRVEGLKISTVKKGITVAKDLFGGMAEAETEQQGPKKKSIIGVINEIKIRDKKGNWFKVLAKVDTGAGITAIDELLARQLGYGPAIDFYNTFGIKRILTKAEVDDLSQRRVWKQLVKHEDIVAVAKVYSSHGISYRMEIPLKFKLAEQDISSNSSVVIRENLKYPLIIGRRDLRKFLIDPGK